VSTCLGTYDLEACDVETVGYPSYTWAPVISHEGQTGHWVCLTPAGINGLFDGTNAIALIAACYSHKTGNWGARVACFAPARYGRIKK
jgi:hypothetical protein